MKNIQFKIRHIQNFEELKQHATEIEVTHNDESFL